MWFESKDGAHLLPFKVGTHGFMWKIERPDYPINIYYSGERFYIHPDSVHLLEPQVGDAVEFDRWHWDRQRYPETKDYPYDAHYGVIKPFGRNDEGMSIVTAGHGWDTKFNNAEKFSIPFKIIQRNGLAFHWPEVENEV